MVNEIRHAPDNIDGLQTIHLDQLTILRNERQAHQYRKKLMIDTFKKSQSEWLKYRDDYCNVATTDAQATHFLGAAFTGCNINMNNRRINEIQIIKMKNVE